MYVDADEDEEEFEIPMSLLWRFDFLSSHVLTLQIKFSRLFAQISVDVYDIQISRRPRLRLQKSRPRSPPAKEINIVHTRRPHSMVV